MKKRVMIGGTLVDWNSSKIYDIVYFDGKILNYTSSYTSNLGAAVGIIFRKTSDRVYIVSGKRFSGVWGGNGYTGGEITTTHSVAQADLKGLYNTNMIMENLGSTASAAYKCRTHTTDGTKVGDWYMPAEGENYLMYQGKSTINSKILSIGGTQFGSEDYWSSTVVDNSNAWHVRMSAGNIYYDIRSWTRYYRPCLCLDLNGNIIRE